MPISDGTHGVDSNNPFYFNTSHWSALDGVLEGVGERAGLMLLTGPPGSGKTMLMRAISDNLPEHAKPLFLQYASLNFREFVNFLHGQLNVEDEIADAANKAVALREFLYVQAKRGETAVVFIDEAHNLEPDVLKMLPKLARFDVLETGETVGLQFVLIGSEDMREFLDDADMGGVRDKLGRDFELRYFTRAELEEFLEKRLAPIARTTDEPITRDGVDAVGRFTGGSPRLIGMICSHAMLFAAENPGKSIDEEMVEDAAEALMLKEIDDPFAHEASLESAVTGPFSQADLDASNAVSTAPADNPSTTDTIYDADVPGDEGSSAPVEAGTVTAQKQMADHDLDAVEDDFSGAVAMDMPDDLDSFDEYDMNSFDEDEYDVDSDFALDDVYDEHEDEGMIDGAVAASGAAAAGVGGSLMSRIGLGKSKKASKKEMSRIVGAQRGRTKSVESDATAQKAAPRAKTRVAGERQRKMKWAGAGIAALALIGGAWAFQKPAMQAIAGVGDSVKGVFASVTSSAPKLPKISTPELPDVVTAELPKVTAPELPQLAEKPIDLAAEMAVADDTEVGGGFGSVSFDQAAQTKAPETPIAPTNSAPKPKPQQEVVTSTTRSGGWGARVVVDGASDQVDAVKEQVVAAVEKPTKTVADTVLGGVQQLLDSGTRKRDTSALGGVLGAASDKIGALRGQVTTSGLSAEERKAKALELISEGKEHFSANRLVSPPGSNAYDAYRNALQLDPGNERAAAGIRELREFYAKKAEGARNAKLWDSANKYFETAIAISQLRTVPR